jgi:TolB-like protein
MVSGKRAFAGDSTPAIMAALLRDEPPPLQTSPPLEKIVRRCLAKQPSARYQAIAEVRTALEAVSREMEAKSSTEPQPSIAVLPFVNMSGDKEQEYFSDGLAEEIINVLAHIPGLRVAGRTSSFFFRSKDVEFTEIGKRLNVEHILEGSVRRSGSSIRVTAQLIKVADGFHLWSERYDRNLTDVFAIQDEIAAAITDALKIKLSITASDQRHHEPNLAAHEAYLKARYYFGSLSPESLSAIKGYFEQAIAADPDYAQPWFGLATYYWLLGNQGIMPAKAASAKCREALLKALELDELLPEAHSLLGVLKVMQFDWMGAESEFRRALELGPKVFDVWMHYSIWYLFPKGCLNEAVAAARMAVEMDPLSPIAQHQLGVAYLLAREYDQAIEQFGKLLELNPRFGLAHLFLGIAKIITGRQNKGVASIEAGVHLLGRTPLSLAFLASVYARAGRISEAHKLLAELQDAAHRTYVSPFHFALVYLGFGDVDACFDWLDKAFEERNSMIFIISVNPLFDPLRSHPRYHALLRKMNLGTIGDVPS